MPTPALHAEHQALVDALPASLHALIQAARALELRGDLTRAVALLDAACARIASPALQLAIAPPLMRLGQHREALSHLIRALKLRRDDPTTLLLTCECLIACGDLARARGILRQAEQAHASTPQVQNLRRRIEHLEGQHDAATRGLAPPPPFDATIVSGLSVNPLHESRTLSIVESPEAPTIRRANLAPLDEATRFELDVLTDDAPPQTPIDDASAHSTFLGMPQARVVQRDERARDPRLISGTALGLPHVSAASADEAHDEDEDGWGGAFQGNTFDDLPEDTRAEIDPPGGATDPWGARGDDLGISVDFGEDTSHEDVLAARARLFGSGPPALPRQPAPPSEEHTAPNLQAPNLQAPPPIAPHRSAAPRTAAPPLPSQAATRAPQQHATPLAEPEPELLLDRPPISPRPTRQPQPQAPHQAQPHAPHHPQAPSQPASRAHLRAGVHRQGGGAAPKRRSVSPGLIALLITLGLGTATYGTLWWADSATRASLEAPLQLARLAPQADTEQAYTSALDALNLTALEPSPLGATIDAIAQRGLSWLPGLRAQALREEAVTQTIWLSALVEARFETHGARQVSDWINRARPLGLDDHPRVLAAQILQATATDARDAETLSSAAMQLPERSTEVLEARAMTQLALDQPTRAWETLAPLRTGAPHTRQLALMGYAALGAGLRDGPSPFQKILDQHRGPDAPPQARIGLARVAAARGDLGQRTRAWRALITLLDKPDLLSGRTRADAALAAAALAPLVDQGDRQLTLIQQARDADPAHPAPLAAQTRVALARGQVSEANALREQAKNISAWPMPLVDAEIALARGDDALAAQHLTQAQDLSPERHMLAGQLAMRQERWEEAVNHFARAQSLDALGGAPEAWVSLAKLRGLPVESPTADALRAKLASLMSTHHDNPRVLHAGALALLDAAKAAPPGEPARKQHLKRADEALTRALSQSADPREPTITLCALRQAQGLLEEAEAPCDALAKLAPYHPGAITARVNLKLRQRALDDARALMLDALSTLPDSAPVPEDFTRALIQLGLLEQAQRALDARASQPQSQLPTTRALRGRVAFAQGRDALAISYFDQASGLPEAQVFGAYARVRLGKPEDAETILKAQLAHPRWGGHAWLALGELRRRQSNFKDAEENLAKAIQLLKASGQTPELLAQAWLQRALTWQMKHGWDHSRVDLYLRYASQVDAPASTELLYVRGLRELYRRRRPNMRAAIALLDQALALDENHCLAMRALDYALKKDNQDERAQSLATRLATHCPNP